MIKSQFDCRRTFDFLDALAGNPRIHQNPWNPGTLGNLENLGSQGNLRNLGSLGNLENPWNRGNPIDPGNRGNPGITKMTLILPSRALPPSAICPCFGTASAFPHLFSASRLSSSSRLADKFPLDKCQGWDLSALVLVLLAVVQGEVVLFGLWSGTCLGTTFAKRNCLGFGLLGPSWCCSANRFTSSPVCLSIWGYNGTSYKALTIRLAGT